MRPPNARLRHAFRFGSDDEEMQKSLENSLKEAPWAQLEDNELRERSSSSSFAHQFEAKRTLKIKQILLKTLFAVSESENLLSWVKGSKDVQSLLKKINSEIKNVPVLYDEVATTRREKQVIAVLEMLETSKELYDFCIANDLEERFAEALNIYQNEDPASIESEDRRKYEFGKCFGTVLKGLALPEIREHFKNEGFLGKYDAALARIEARRNYLDIPSLVVIDEIGDNESNEGKNLLKQYGWLAKPVPLATLNVNIAAMEAALAMEFPAFQEVIQSVCAELRLRQNAGVESIRLRPILLAGPPGVGKTRFAQKLAHFLGTGFGALSVSGSDDSRILLGTSRGWGNRTPSFPILTIQKTGVANPVILVDEIEKGAVTPNHGKIADSILPYLEPETSKRQPDDCFLAICDFSQISWILTANDLTKLSAALLSRCTVFEIEKTAPNPGNLLSQIQSDIASELGLQVGELPELDPQICAALENALAKGASIRRIKKLVMDFLSNEPAQPKLLN